nr:MAG TPA: hypothetical protein [Caudoviricetes sp.]
MQVFGRNLLYTSRVKHQKRLFTNMTALDGLIGL